MAALRPFTVERKPVPIHSQVAANLRYIRRTMESAGQFTAIPGHGGMLMGLTAMVAAAVAHSRAASGRWLTVWMCEALLGAAIAFGFAQRKAQKLEKPLLAGPGRKFVLALLPPIFVAALLTGVLWRAGQVETIAPGLWLLLYGVGIVAGGAFSVRAVPVMGLCFLGLGTLALLTPGSWGDFWLATGFGGVQLIFGWVIARNHGG